MSATSRLLLLAALGLAAPLAAWTDPMEQWHAGAYLQLLQVDRPGGVLPPAGPLNSDGATATGYSRDGLYWKNLETKLWGPLGWDHWSATLAVATNLNSVGFTDAYVQRLRSGGRWGLKLGQERLPFGWENQVGSASLVTIQRSLMFGFQNYGHVGNWGLGLLNERGAGLRVDYYPQEDRPWAGYLQGGLFYAGAQGWRPGPLLAQRAALAWRRPAFRLEAGASAAAGALRTDVAEPVYAPLGTPPQGSRPLSDLAQVGGGTEFYWMAGLDLGLDWGFAHVRWEGAGYSRRQYQATVWLDLPSWTRRPLRLYGRDERAYGWFVDGIHGDTAYKAETVGLSLPLPASLTLKLERLQVRAQDPEAVTTDAWKAEYYSDGTLVPGGDLWQAQLQLDL